MLLVPPALGGFLGAEAEVIDPAPVATPLSADAALADSAPMGPWEIGGLALHLAWALAAALAIWRRGWLRLRSRGIARITPTAESETPGAGTMLIAGGIAIYCAIFVGAASAGAILGRGDAAAGITEADHSLWRGAWMLIGGYIGAACALVFFLALVPGAARLIGLPSRAAELLGGIRRGLAGIAVAYPIVWVAGWIITLLARAIAGDDAIETVAHETLRSMQANPRDPAWWTTAALVTIGAPIVEEIVYRGFLQPGIRLLIGRPWLAVILPSILFAFVHGEAVPWHALPVLFVLSLALGIARARTGSIVPSIVMHALFNAANIGLVMAGV